jgi:hypothetical protein
MIDRTSALGLLTFGDEYATAAAMLRQRDRHYVNAPLFYLYAHALELHLKAFLRARNFTLAQLKTLGHDLSALLTEARQRGLASHVLLTPEQVAAITAVNVYYHEKELEYIVTGIKHFPPPDLLAAAAGALYSGLESVCYQHMQAQRK